MRLSIHVSDMQKRYTYILIGLMLFLLLADAQAQPVRRGRRGIIVYGSGKQTRAVEPFGATLAQGKQYAEVVNRYRSLLSPDIRVYGMPIPSAIAFYCPEKARKWTGDEGKAVAYLLNQLAEGVIPVPIVDTLKAHSNEPIYSRTDHHWAPLGAYYAARELASAAQVPFRDLSSYDTITIRNYVGTMYRFSRVAAVKYAPEEFVYYKPRDIAYTTTITRYLLGRDGSVVGAKEPEESPFFYDFSDGSSGAYLTFMHGDSNNTQVRTATKNGRRLLILKDSFGNALPGYLFYSFEEIHVVDSRYFPDNILDYIQKNQITDVVFCNNIIHASMAKIQENLLRYLEQEGLKEASTEEVVEPDEEEIEELEE